MKISNKTYDTLKWITQYLLPAIGALYFALSNIWGLPNCEEVLGTLTAVDAFLGVILGITSKQYNKTKDGSLIFNLTDPEEESMVLSLNEPFESLVNRTSLNLKVERTDTHSQK